MNNALILQHASSFGPGRLLPAFQDNGIPVEIRHLYRGDQIPQLTGELRCLVILSGPMSVTDIGSEQHPYLQPEIELIQQFVRKDRPVLGIGLGAQLLAHAADAKVYPNTTPAKGDQPAQPAPEFGWEPITLPFPGGTDPMVFGIMDGAPMFHWHFDTFDLPKLPGPANPPPPPAPRPPTGNLLLCSTRKCKNQVFRFKNHLYGFQYHFELTQDQIGQIVAEAPDAVKSAVGASHLDAIAAQTQKNYQLYSRLGDRLTDNFVQYLKVNRL